jgi:hypothetical protein
MQSDKASIWVRSVDGLDLQRQSVIQRHKTDHMTSLLYAEPLLIDTRRC